MLFIPPYVSDEKGGCICPLNWSVHCNFIRDVKCIVKGGGLAVNPPTLTSNFPIKMECTPESSSCHSVCTLWFQLPGWNCVHYKCWRILAHPFRQLRRNWPHLHCIHRFEYSIDLDICGPVPALPTLGSSAGHGDNGRQCRPDAIGESVLNS
jgi:hypothetical protein